MINSVEQLEQLKAERVAKKEARKKKVVEANTNKLNNIAANSPQSRLSEDKKNILSAVTQNTQLSRKNAMLNNMKDVYQSTDRTSRYQTGDMHENVTEPFKPMSDNEYKMFLLNAERNRLQKEYAKNPYTIEYDEKSGRNVQRPTQAAYRIWEIDRELKAEQARQNEEMVKAMQNRYDYESKLNQNNNLIKNIGSAFAAGGRGILKGISGTRDSIQELGTNAVYDEPYNFRKHIKNDVNVIQDITDRKPELIPDIEKYFVLTNKYGSMGEKGGSLFANGKAKEMAERKKIEEKLRSELGNETFSYINDMAQYRNPIFYLKDENTVSAQKGGLANINFEQSGLAQKDREYTENKMYAPTWQQTAMDAAESIPLTATSAAVSILSPAAGLAVMGGVSYGTSYADEQQREYNPKKSAKVALGKAALEVATEKLPMDEFTSAVKNIAGKGLKQSIKRGVTSLLTQGIEENIGEQLSLLGEKFIDQSVYGDGEWDTYLDEAIKTAKATTLSTLFFTGATLSTSSALGAIDEKRRARLEKNIAEVERKSKSGEINAENVKNDENFKSVIKDATTAIGELNQAGKLGEVEYESGIDDEISDITPIKNVAATPQTSQNVYATVEEADNMQTVQSTNAVPFSAAENAPSKTVSVGDTFKDTKTGNTAENDVAPNTDINKKNDIPEAFRRDENEKIRFNQLDIDYNNTTMREGQFRVAKSRANTDAKLVEKKGWICGKYGVYKDKGNEYAVTHLQSGARVAILKNLSEAKQVMMYLDKNLSFNNATYKRGAVEGSMYPETTDELSKYLDDIKRIHTEKPYLDTVVTEIQDGKVPSYTKEELIDYVKAPSINNKNTPKADGNISVNEDTTNIEKDVAEDENSVISNAINDTLFSKAKLDIINKAKKHSVKNGIEVFAKNLKKEYEQKGTIEKYSGYFKDGGEKVVTLMSNSTSNTAKDSNKNVKEEKKRKIIRAKKSDWASHDVYWYAPNSKTVVAYSTVSASDLIGIMADDNPKMTISEMYSAINYDTEAKKVLQAYINSGFGDSVASEFFSYQGRSFAAEENADTISSTSEMTDSKALGNTTLQDNDVVNDRKKLYDVYRRMKDRCYNSKASDYKYYGEKGVKIHKSWLDDFENFYEWAVKNGYKQGLTIDRIDPYGSYEPNNCRWVSMAVQNRNKRNETDTDESVIKKAESVSKVDDVNTENLETSNNINEEKSVYEILEELGLTYDEQRAILNYKSGKSYVLNEALREGKELTDAQTKFLADLESAMDKFPQYIGVVYRNIGFNTNEQLSEFMKDYSVGELISIKGFISTSKSETGYELHDDIPYKAHYEIEIKNGFNVANIGLKEEQEILLKHNTQFIVQDITYSGSEVFIKMKEVENDAQSGTQNSNVIYGTENGVAKKGRKDEFVRGNEGYTEPMDSVQGGIQEDNSVLDTKSDSDRGRDITSDVRDSISVREGDRDKSWTQRVSEQQRERVQTHRLTDKCELVTTKHTQTGDDLWVVTLKYRISPDEFKDLRAKVKSVGGYYSSFAKTPDGKAIPGFVFKTEPAEKEIKVFNDFFGYSDDVLNNQTESDIIEENADKESVDNVHDGVLAGESGNDSAVRKSEPISEIEEKRNIGAEDRELSENVTAEGGTDVQDTQRETTATKSDNTGSGDNGIRKSDNGDGDSGSGAYGDDTYNDEINDDVQSTKESKAKDYAITKAVAEELDTKAPNMEDNIAAIETLHKLENGNKAPTKAQQSILAKFKGWGGLTNAFYGSAKAKLQEIMSENEIKAAQSTVNDAYFTPTSIIDSVYKALNHLGFEGGNILEPSMGVGNFFGRMPKAVKDNSTLFGVEIDSISGRIAQKLYPSANIEIAPFQDVAYKDGAFDLIIGNVPFGEVKYKYKGKKYLIHDYFFIKAMDKLNDGGILAFLTTKGTLDKLDSTTRTELNNQGRIIGAYRLPSNVFTRSAGANVVTDLIIMQKTSNASGENFVNLGSVKVGDETFSVNEYFANHPENIIGEFTTRRDWRSGKTELDVNATGNVAEQLAKAIRKLPKNLLSGVQTVGNVNVVENTTPMQTFTVDKKGEVKYIDAATGEVKQIKGKSAKVAKEYVGLKNIYQELIDATLGDYETNVVEGKRKALNTAYDEFVKEHGSLEKNKKVLSADNDFYKMSGLEVYDTKTKKIIKSEMFTKDTLGKKKPKKADNVLDALSISIGETGGVDLNRIAELTGVSESEAIKQLDDRIVYTPDGDYELNEVYLSGNVREKYEAVKGKKGFEKNERMLKAVIPEDIPAKNITPQFGSPWIKPEYVADFLKETLHLYNKPVVSYDATTGTWAISGNTWGDSTLMTNKYGTKYMDAIKIAEKALNMRRIVVTDKNKKVIVGETRAAQQKAEDIKTAFEEWCFKDADRRKDLVATFNEKFNSNRNMDFSELAKYLTFDGLTDTFKLRDYQKRAVARAVFNGNTLLAHGVGTGKTAEMIAIAMELKRMGIAKKNMMVVPPHKVADFRNDILKMYPSAKVAMLEKGANATQRQRFYALVASNDFDIVIIPHSSFGMLDVSADTKKAFINNQISELEEVLTATQAEKGKIDGRFIKSLENQKKRLEEKLKFVTETAKDNGNTFEELGVDSLFVDEAHNFKNLPFFSKLSRVAGVSVNQSSNKKRASRAENMFMITDFLNRNNGRITFGTATPITNSMSEIYNMIRFLRPDILADSGLQSFDAWASMFGSIVNQAEVDPSGRNMRMKERFSKFKNVSQMIEQFRRMADILKTGDVIQELPEVERIDIVNESNDIQEEFLDIIDEMIDDIRTNGQRAGHNMLEVTTAGQMAAVDLRFVASYFDGKYTTDDLNLPNNRTTQVATKVYKEYVDSNATKGTQFVFCDVGVNDDPSKKYNFYVYGDLINKLVSLGIPRNEIAVAQDFEDKADLSARVNTGEIRVLIGSTAVMGEGMNAQNKAVALHHVTVPARPSDIEQREGRIIRYGNENKKVRIYRYIQEKSYDSYQWQMQERKANFINQALSGGTVEELEEMSDFQLSAREAKAIASGNPLLLEKIEVEDKLSNLKSIRNKFNTDKLEMQDRLAVLPNRIQRKVQLISDIKADLQTIDSHKTKNFEITFGKTKYVERAKAAEALARGLSKIPKNGAVVKIGSFRGLDLLYCSSFEKGTEFILQGAGKYIVTGGESASGNITRLINTVGKIADNLAMEEKFLHNYRSEFETLKKEVKAEFPQAKQLEELQAKLNDIDTQLGINVSTVDMSEVIVADETEDSGDERYSIESEDMEYEQGNGLLSGSSEWADNESAGKQAEKISAFKQEIKGKSQAERKAFAKELFAKKYTEEKIDGTHKYNLVKPEAYNDDMLSMVREAESRGKEIGFFVGRAIRKFDGARKFLIDGIKISDTKILVRYDGNYSPQTLLKHEDVHTDWNSPEMQEAKDMILNDISDSEKKRLLSDGRYKDYMDLYGNDEAAVWEEFIADVLSGMSDYTADYIDIVADYWYDGKVIDRYSPAEYNNIIDAGHVNVYNNGELTKKEWREFYNSLSELERGMWYPQTSDGDYIFETEEKLIFTDGDYIAPKVNSVIVFEGLDSEEIEYGKETAYYAAQRDKDSQECYEAVRNVLGQKYVTRTNPYPDKAYQGSKNGKRKGNYSLKANSGIESKTKYALSTDSNNAELDDYEVLDLLEMWERAIDEFGTIPKGENPVREINVPKKISDKKYVSRFARTMLEAGVTPDDTVSEFEQAILDGKMTHEVITNKKASDWAKQQIEYHGFEEALKIWSVLSNTEKVGKKEFALGMELYNQCITNKDVHNAMKIAAELAAEATRAGQTLQAARMLKLMTPDGQLYYLEKSIEKMNDEFRKKLGDKYKDIVLDEELLKAFLEETDEKRRDILYDKLCRSIADQIPSTALDKWNSWRYLAMLGNPRTHIRNIVGNGAFWLTNGLKNYIGAAIETIAKVDTGKRTRSFKKSKEAVEFAQKDFLEMRKVLQGENAKYAITSDIEGKRTIFKTKALEKLRLKNFDFLEMEDMWFLKAHYVSALANLITVRKIDPNSITPETLNTLRAFAIKEAQSATYRDANALADGLNRIQRSLERSDNRWVRGTSFMIEGVMPFKKTPLNIAKQGVNYSPVGIMKAVYKGLKKLKNGTATTTEVIDDLAKGLTGTGIILLGFWLANIGVLKGDDDRPEKEKEFDKMVGEQSYSLQIGETSYTIDWLSPLNLSLFVGAKLHSLTKDGFSFADVTGALATISEPLLELSVFSGINSLVESAQYSDSEAVLAMVSDMATSYLLQALPTMGGQISRMIDRNKREYYYTDKNSDIPKGIQRFLGQASSKIPFLSFLYQPSIDEWGREETYGNIFERTLENTISPGYYSKESYTAVDRELKELYERTGESSVLPVAQQKFYKEGGKFYNMNAEDYTEVKRIRGQLSFDKVKELMESPRYKRMTDEYKVKAVENCYKQAGKEAKEKMLERVKNNSK